MTRSSLPKDFRENGRDGEDLSAFDGEYYITERKVLNKLDEPEAKEMDKVRNTRDCLL